MSSENKALLQKSFLQRKVDSLKPRTAHVLPVAASLKDALKLFKMTHAGSVVVLDDEENLKGIFTERDLVIKFPIGKDLKQIPITSLMSSPVKTIYPKSSIARLLYLISEGGFRHVPVVGKAGEIPHILSVRDVVNFIFKAIARKLTDEDPKEIVDELMIKQFFAAGVDILKPAPVVWAHPNDNMVSVLQQFKQHRAGTILVRPASDSPLGIFTERDFTTRVLIPELKLTETPISAVMTSNPTKIKLHEQVAQAFKIMAEGGYRHIPVVGETGTVVGIIGTHHLIKALTASVIDELSEEED